MEEKLSAGRKVKYLNSKNKWVSGRIHGVRSYEQPNGFIEKVTYLIDTGETVREDVLEIHPKTGKPTKTLRHPEQIELAPQFVKPV